MISSDPVSKQNRFCLLLAGACPVVRHSLAAFPGYTVFHDLKFPKAITTQKVSDELMWGCKVSGVVTYLHKSSFGSADKLCLLKFPSTMTLDMCLQLCSSSSEHILPSANTLQLFIHKNKILLWSMFFVNFRIAFIPMHYFCNSNII